MIGCETYEKLREIEGKEGFADLPETQNDIEVACAGLRRLGFKKKNIVKLANPEYMALSMAVMDAKKIVYENHL